MKERRESPRYEMVLRIRYETQEAFQDAVIHNLSTGGLYLATQTPFNVGHEFQIEVGLPGKDEWIKGTCTVVWVNEIDTLSYPKGMGVMFLEMPPKYKEYVQKYSEGVGVEKN